MRLILFFSLLFLCLQSGYGQTSISALKDKGEDQFKLGQYEDSIKTWKQLYPLTKDPKILLNLGNCYWKLKRYEEALSSYKGFLVQAPKSELAPFIKDYVRDLEAILKQGSIELTTNYDPVEVYVDSVLRGVTPLEVKELNPGTHEVVLKKVGFQEYKQSVTLEIQQKQKLVLTLKPLPGSISVSSAQDPAEVYIDGVLVGQSPMEALDVTPGSHLVALDKSGFTQYQVQLQVEPAQDVVLRPVLEVAMGSLSISTNLKGAEVRLNAQKIGRTDELGKLSMSVPVGQYELGVSSRWFLPNEQKILLVEDIPQQLEVSCKAPPKLLALYAAPPSLLLLSGFALRAARIRQSEIAEAQGALLVITPDDAEKLHKEWVRGISLVVTADIASALAIASGAVAVWGSINRLKQRAERSAQ